MENGFGSDHYYSLLLFSSLWLLLPFLLLSCFYYCYLCDYISILIIITINIGIIIISIVIIFMTLLLLLLLSLLLLLLHHCIIPFNTHCSPLSFPVLSLLLLSLNHYYCFMIVFLVILTMPLLFCNFLFLLSLLLHEYYYNPCFKYQNNYCYYYCCSCYIVVPIITSLLYPL